MSSFQTEEWIPVELREVFAFFSDPNNLPRIMPSELRAQVLSIDLVGSTNTRIQGAAAGVGTTITFSFRPVPFLPIRQKWVAQIVAFAEGPETSYFQDRQERGPFKTWLHTHRFESVSRDGCSGTLIIDSVEFEVGYGFIGRALESMIAERMRKTFAHRHAALQAQFQRD